MKNLIFFLNFIQDLETDVPLQQEIVESLQDSLDTLSGHWKCDEIESDISTSKERFEKLKLDIEGVATCLPHLKESFENLPPLLESLAWVQELMVLIDIDVDINEREDVEKEMNRLQVRAKKGFTVKLCLDHNSGTIVQIGC